MRRLVAVDIETSGLEVVTHQVLEIGCAWTNEDDTMQVYACSLPFSKMSFNGVPNWTQEALEVNGWGKREFAPQVSPCQAVSTLRRLLDDAHIVGKSPQFDEKFLRVLFEREHIMPPWHHRLVDVGPLAWGWYNTERVRLGGPSWDLPPSVSKVEEWTGIKRETVGGYHTALNDAVWAYRVFRSIVPA
jgi:oligoribonuclease (3'-5' exoribonuclease)